MLSIITNFGCDVGCEYCIWKQHLLKKHKTTLASTNWKFLKQAIKGMPRISISGGGDPLHDLKVNSDWWERLFSIKAVRQGKTIIDLHTGKIAPQSFLDKFQFNKYVYHVKNLSHFHLVSELIDMKIKNLYVVIVANEKYAENDYMYMARELKHHNIPFAIRQKVVDNKAIEIRTEFLEKELWWKYIKQADYNTYFMPDNNIYDKFLMGKVK